MRTTPHPFLSADRRGLLGAPRCESCGSGAVTRRAARAGGEILVCSACGRGQEEIRPLLRRKGRRSWHRRR